MPSILLPYPQAADDHQLANARAFSAGGGCVTIDEREMPGRLDDRLADMLCFLLANDGVAAADVGGDVPTGPARRCRGRGGIDLVDRQQPIAARASGGRVSRADKPLAASHRS